MPSFCHSDKALRIVSSFHRNKIILYVEASGDILFWKNILKIAGIDNVYIKTAGGKREIDRYIKLILSGDSQIVVARDNDYSEILNHQIDHVRIIYTYGYSIENTLYCPRIIASIVSKLAKSEDNDMFEESVRQWYRRFCVSCQLLLTYDLASEKYEKGVEVMGDSSHSFLVSSQSCNLSETKISSRIDDIKEIFTEDEINDCKELMRNYGKELIFLIRGHFYTAPILNLIKKLVKEKRGSRPVIPKGNLYSMTIDGCLLCDSECMDISGLKDALRVAVGVDS